MKYSTIDKVREALKTLQENGFPKATIVATTKYTQPNWYTWEEYESAGVHGDFQISIDLGVVCSTKPPLETP